ncbi:Transcription factor RLM1 [Pleurostoma richardsiae]|uniref:MADS-box MEF2 type transcription factor MIG1 n=1 Tax=Pleurostoma richardsiae TaxID=41990 RepID=A0AA38VI28_9PEZI|nr:Transcription factor RLM1 [Pleurostoma richardsiae]
MGRRKIEIKAIKDDRNRSVTFLKRKGGLFKKAHELSVLCSVDVAVFIFGSNKKLYEYSSGDMRELITRYTYHGGPNEHKGPADFNGGADDEDEDDENGTPPHMEGMEPHMMPPHHFSTQPPFPQIRHHTPSASPPIPNGVVFAQHAAQHIQRGHTPQPPIGSRPGSRNDMRRMGPNMGPQQVGPPGPPQGPPVNGYAFMPHPAIYNPQNPPNMPPNMPQQGPQYPYPPPPPHMQPYMEDQRRSSLPPNYPPQHPSQPTPGPRPSVSPQPHHQQLPPQQLPPQPIPHASPQPPHHPMRSPPQPPPPQQQQPPPPQIQEPPPAPVEPKTEGPLERPPQPPLLDTASAIKKLPQRKQHSIFTPIDENRSILSQHLAAFHNDPQVKVDTSPANRSQAADPGSVPRNEITTSPPVPKRTDAPNASKARQVSVSSIPENVFTPPSRSNSLRVGGSSRPRLKVQIPDEPSDAGSATAESTSPAHANSTDVTSQTSRRNGPDSHSSGVVLPPPSPSASAILSAGATGPPNPFARPPPSSHNMNVDTPVSALPSRFLNNEFLPSPSSFYPEWNYRGSDSNTLPSPLNFTTPVGGIGPSFLRDESTSVKRKSPEVSGSGPTSDPIEPGNEAKRVKVDS